MLVYPVPTLPAYSVLHPLLNKGHNKTHTQTCHHHNSRLVSLTLQPQHQQNTKVNNHKHNNSTVLTLVGSSFASRQIAGSSDCSAVCTAGFATTSTAASWNSQQQYQQNITGATANVTSSP
jgi:hypothetical protein